VSLFIYNILYIIGRILLSFLIWNEKPLIMVTAKDLAVKECVSPVNEYVSGTGNRRVKNAKEACTMADRCSSTHEGRNAGLNMRLSLISKIEILKSMMRRNFHPSKLSKDRHEIYQQNFAQFNSEQVVAEIEKLSAEILNDLENDVSVQPS
jgi:hypothetical protein